MAGEDLFFATSLPFSCGSRGVEGLFFVEQVVELFGDFVVLRHGCSWRGREKTMMARASARRQVSLLQDVLLCGKIFTSFIFLTI